MKFLLLLFSKYGKRAIRAMDLDTHSVFLRHLGNLLTVYKDARHEVHMRSAATILSGKTLASSLASDTSGKKARDILLEAAAHLQIAADKVVKEQERR